MPTPMRRGCRAPPASPSACRPIGSGPTRRAAALPMRLSPQTPKAPIRAGARLPFMTRTPIATLGASLAATPRSADSAASLGSPRRRSRSAPSGPMNTGCSTWQAMSGNGPAPALCARFWMPWARSKPPSQLRGPPRRGAPSRLHARLHPRCAGGRLLGRHAAQRHRLSPCPRRRALMPRQDGRRYWGATSTAFHHPERHLGHCARTCAGGRDLPAVTGGRNCISLPHQACAKMQKR